MIERELGNSGLRVSALGLGCMGMSEFYDPKQMNDEEAVRLTEDDLARIDAALPPDAASGARYPAHAMRAIDR